ncbi:hypothetical protein Rumeso_02295 [Rubellimicrobium mesophilum DSM 19309]|uniref:Uncharacterized protein n=1 Tax=Rubellimicrobium mesophilum DSM 19309 TaxID=442562 RepID=A0A017HP15_9RHOB|nr:hypothetical protein [Rubellimicrobium mesophilum]EYD76106.1 hypothetical protein Rumeso_02295 [Rubellimicrobium mesophilum DSM 19309]
MVKTESHFDGKGVSIIAGGEINLASNSNLTACPPPPGAPPTAMNYLLVR